MHDQSWMQSHPLYTSTYTLSPSTPTSPPSPSNVDQLIAHSPILIVLVTSWHTLPLQYSLGYSDFDVF
jgi:hypothetical protein